MSPSSDLLAGVAQVDITPPEPGPLAGYYERRDATGTHDPLLAKAIYWRQGGTEAALVACDLIGIPWAVTEPARKQMQQQTGIPGDHLIVAATHAHTGPQFDLSPPSTAARSSESQAHDERVAKAYVAFLASRIAEAVREAKRSAVAVNLLAGTTQQQNLSFNRRFFMKDGSVRFNPGKLNPEIVRPAGPIDPQVGLLLLQRAEDRSPFGSLTVFALHLDTVGGTEYSADYPYYLSESLRRQFGERFVSVLGNGTCGDINHLDVSHKGPQKGQEEARRIGETLAETIKAALPSLKPIRPGLAVRAAVLDVPVQKPTAEELAWAEQADAQSGGRNLPFMDKVKLAKIKHLRQRNADTWALPVQAIRLSDEVAIVGLPGEVFVDLGLVLKKSSPFPTTLIIELCNERVSYIPTQKAFAEGSYEVVNSRLAPGGGEKLIEAAKCLLQELHGSAN